METFKVVIENTITSYNDIEKFEDEASKMICKHLNGEEVSIIYFIQLLVLRFLFMNSSEVDVIGRTTSSFWFRQLCSQSLVLLVLSCVCFDSTWFFTLIICCLICQTSTNKGKMLLPKKATSLVTWCSFNRVILVIYADGLSAAKRDMDSPEFCIPKLDGTRHCFPNSYKASTTILPVENFHFFSSSNLLKADSSAGCLQGTE